MWAPSGRACWPSKTRNNKAVVELPAWEKAASMCARESVRVRPGGQTPEVLLQLFTTQPYDSMGYPVGDLTSSPCRGFPSGWPRRSQPCEGSVRRIPTVPWPLARCSAALRPVGTLLGTLAPTPRVLLGQCIWPRRLMRRRLCRHRRLPVVKCPPLMSVTPPLRPLPRYDTPGWMRGFRRICGSGFL